MSNGDSAADREPLLLIGERDRDCRSGEWLVTCAEIMGEFVLAGLEGEPGSAIGSCPLRTGDSGLMGN